MDHGSWKSLEKDVPFNYEDSWCLSFRRSFVNSKGRTSGFSGMTNFSLWFFGCLSVQNGEGHSWPSMILIWIRWLEQIKLIAPNGGLMVMNPITLNKHKIQFPKNLYTFQVNPLLEYHPPFAKWARTRLFVGLYLHLQKLYTPEN